jgi:hypothetical protein
MLALLLASNLAAVTNADLQMKLTAVKSNVLVGEFTKVRVEWLALKQVDVLFGAERLLIDDGTGFRPHAEADLAEATTVSLPTTLQPGTREITEYMIGLVEVDVPSSLSGMEAAVACLQFAFNRPGRYRVKVQYTTAESNEVAIDVSSPAGGDAELLQALRRQPLVLTWMGDTERDLLEYGEQLIDQHRGHPYLTRLLLRHSNTYERTDFDRLRSIDLSQTAFEDERLLLLAERGLSHMGEDWQRQTLTELVERFPNGVAAQKAKELLLRQDKEPPTLAVSPSPEALWPPNNRLEPIVVSVQVRDDRDPSPTVKLDSITCDDACDPARDISGAAFGTDDRQFAVRSERRGAGTGRTYKITYSAEDATGNRTTTQAAVTVAHDQGQDQRPGDRGAWSSDGVSYRVNDLVTHEGFTWKCIQAHSSRWDWAPSRVPALWVKIPKGKEWDHPVQYALGTEVTYQSATYTCRQAHTSQAGWTPTNTPTLWSRK